MNNSQQNQHRKQDNLMIDLPHTTCTNNLAMQQQNCELQIVAIWAP